MRTIIFLWTWLRRIPVRFTAVFLVLYAGYFLLVSSLLDLGDVARLTERLLRLLGLKVLLKSPLVGRGIEGLVIVLLFLLGALLAYNVSALIYRAIRRRPRVRVIGPVDPQLGRGGALERFHRIGIILAGGGAKGAYQAGALRAIYEFLEENDALDKVKMIAGTSIGSWNSMFWLAGLVKPESGERLSSHEDWWRSINVRRIIEFDTYWPLHRNHFFRSTPWQETFRKLFIEPDAVRERLARLFVPRDSGDDPPVHFYFTRSNVETGRLEFATNWPGIRDKKRVKLDGEGEDGEELAVEPGSYEIIYGDDVAEALSHTCRAVFASMDLPPLFPYLKIKVDFDEWFEDGGVVENVPIRFGTDIERCDLLFVLPLNASFAEPVDLSSVTRRLFRVMDVRQGVLERSAFKMIYLYNELAALREKIKRLENADAPGGGSRLEAIALRRTNEPVSVFAICPRAPLAIGTAEFWKPRAAAHAFDLMYAAARYELRENFERDTDPTWIRMTLVSPQGERTYMEDF